MSKYAVEPGSIARSLTMEARAIVAMPVTEKSTQTHTQDPLPFRQEFMESYVPQCFIIAVVP